MASLREIPWVCSITSRGLGPASNSSSQVVGKNVVSARSHDARASSLVRGRGHPAASQRWKPAELGRAPNMQRPAALSGRQAPLSFAASARCGLRRILGFLPVARCGGGNFWKRALETLC